jgi:hypothetical protein
VFADAPTADLLLDALTALAAHMALPGVQVIGKTYKVCVRVCVCARCDLIICWRMASLLAHAQSHPNSKVRARAAALAAGKQ